MASNVDLNFEWDDDKAAANLRKHKVSFDEARTVFADPFSITINDAAHSDDEFRFVDIGVSVNGRILVVVYTERASRTRLISSRQATKAERYKYEQRKEL